MSLPVRKKDSERMKEEIKRFVLMRTETWLEILFEEGYDSFLASLKSDAKIILIKYEVESLTPLKNQKYWAKWDGSVLTDIDIDQLFTLLRFHGNPQESTSLLQA